MATIHFYEKPGCINNTRQKKLLVAAGHEVIVYNLLAETWTPTRLQAFLGQYPVCDWFNRSAPRIKSGEIIPEQVNAETALQLMVENPLLIRRPLIQVGDQCKVGFDIEDIDQWVGLALVINERLSHEQLRQQDLQTCPNMLK